MQYVKSLIYILALISIFTNCQTEKRMTEERTVSAMFSKMDLEAPSPKKEAHEMTIHDHTRTDDYYWMKLTDEQKQAEEPDAHTQEVLDYLNGENTYREGVMSHLKGFQDELFEEIKGRIKKDDASVPYKSNGYWYYTRYEKGKEYPFYCRKKGTQKADEEVMMNVNEMAEGFDYYQLGGLSVSPDNKWLAYSVDTLSRRIYTIYFKNMETGEIIEDKIENTTGRAVWANDNKTLFFTTKDETLRAHKIWKHKLGGGTPDKEIYEEKDATFGTFVYKTKSKKYLVIGSYQTLSSEYRILEADNPDGEFRMFQKRERDHEYGIDHYKDNFYVTTNMDAKNFRLMVTPETKTSKENWKELIPHRSDVLLEGIEIFKDYLVVSERIKGIMNLRVRPWDGSDEHYIDFGEDAYVAAPSVNRDFDTEIMRVGYTSMTTPSSTFDYNMKERKLDLLKEQIVLGDFDKTNYKSERVFATVRDGVEVPISLVYRKDKVKKDGTAPLLLYAYGSYGSSMDPYFSSVRLSLLDRGFVYAIAHIRGGQEMGRHWYEDGKLLKKKNTFNDFIDCGEFLIKEKYGAKDQLYAMGGSAGGLLMGAIVNMRPEMWKGVIAAVPFVDVVTTMLDETIPLTTGEFDEWGNPKNKEYYDYILSYSPYDQVEKKDYPAMMVTTGLHDSQVQYWEPAKWVAKLRDMKTDKNPLVMYCNMETGHSGASGRFERYKETAMEYAFFLDLAGKTGIEVKD